MTARERHSAVSAVIITAVLDLYIRAGALGRMYRHRLERRLFDVVDLYISGAVLLAGRDKSERGVDEPQLVAVATDEIDAVDARGLARIELRIAAGHEDEGLRVVTCGATYHLSGFAIAFGGYGAGIYDVNPAFLRESADYKAVFFELLGNRLTFILVDLTAERHYTYSSVNITGFYF